MKRSILVGAALLILLPQARAVCGAVRSNGRPVSSQGHEAPTVSREFAVASGQEISFHLKTGGRIFVTGWDNNVVSVKATLGGPDGANCRLDMNQTGSGVEIESTYAGSGRGYSTNIRIKVQVPKQFNVSVRSGGGGISIENLEGTITGTTGGGEIQIANSKGQVGLSTGGGEITVTDCDLDGRVATGGGHVRIQGNKGNLTGSTGGGRVEYLDSNGSPAAAATSQRRHADESSYTTGGGAIRIRQGGGDVHLGDAPNGADISTGGGEISIASGRGRVRAMTGGGDIDIGPVDGAVEVSTGGGRINATVISGSSINSGSGGTHSVRAVTGGGDVIITLPPDVSAEFDIKLAFTNNNTKKTYQIISDFPMQQATSDAWATDEGTPRKYITGTGTIGSGENRITVRTVNGNVYIRRGNQ